MENKRQLIPSTESHVLTEFAGIMQMALLRRLQAREAELDREVEEHWRDLEGYAAIHPHLDKAEYQRRHRWMKRTGKLRAA